MALETFNGFSVRKGQVPGTKHTRKGINNQDALRLGPLEIGDRRYYVGLVSDGCTDRDNPKASKTEVGSALLTQFAFSEIRMLLAANTPLTEIPNCLYPRCVSYVGNVARATVAGSPEETWGFIQRHFLATLLGFVMSEVELVAFSAGDGVFIVNDNITIIDQSNAPLYLAYHQLDRRTLSKANIQLPHSFAQCVYNVSSLQRFAVCTDGVVRHSVSQERSCVPIDEVAQYFGYQPQAPAGLQWGLNILQKSGRFDDDTSIIALSRLPAERKEGEDVAPVSTE